MAREIRHSRSKNWRHVTAAFESVKNVYCPIFPLVSGGNIKKLGLITAAALLAAGCSTWDGLSRQEKGTVIGAGAGAVIGSKVTDGPLGVIGGAAVGGVIGNQIGKRQDDQKP